MGLLDYADSARKKLAGLLGDMPLVQIAQGRAEMPTMGGLLASLKSMPVFSPDAGQSAYEAALNIGPMGLGKIVYHGSPHKFDKFDASKIGTGEGAQAYGHGVYLADSEGVADGYRTALSPKKITLDPSLIKEELAKLGFDDKSLNMAKTELQTYKGDVGRTLELLDGLYMNTGYKRAKDAAAVIRAMKPSHKVEQGALYKADLPDEWIPKMLDWDKPLSKQSPEVQGAIGKLQEQYRQSEGLTGPYISPDATGRQIVDELKRMATWQKSANARYNPAQRATEELRFLGIPGIRYLDGGSRGKGQGSYNYVVFPGLEDQVKILERNGIPLSGLLGGQ